MEAVLHLPTECPHASVRLFCPSGHARWHASADLLMTRHNAGGDAVLELLCVRPDMPRLRAERLAALRKRNGAHSSPCMPSSRPVRRGVSPAKPPELLWPGFGTVVVAPGLCRLVHACLAPPLPKKLPSTRGLGMAPAPSACHPRWRFPCLIFSGLIHQWLNVSTAHDSDSCWAPGQEAVVQMERQQASQMRKDAGLPRTRRCRKCRVRRSSPGPCICMRWPFRLFGSSWLCLCRRGQAVMVWQSRGLAR